jgi:hypothetical protein
MSARGALRGRLRAAHLAPADEPRRSPLVARESWLVGGIAAFIVGFVLILAGDGAHHGFYGPSDSPLFLAVARSPFGNGHSFIGDPRIQGVAYRYGRILLPLTGWVLGLGQTFAVKWTLALAFAASFGAWVAFAAEHLRRGNRSPRIALWVFGTPWALLWLAVPGIVSEPMAGALVLLSYLYARERRDTGARVAAAFAILARELMLVAFVPLAWRAWKERRWAGVRDWALVLVPYLLWCTWVRFRIGQFPFLDPATSRRNALAAPFTGWYRTMVGPLDNGQGLAVLIAAVTIVAVALVARRGHWLYPVTHGAVALAALSLCYGVAVYAFPGEAYRVMAPTQMLLIIAACDRSQRGTEDERVTEAPRPDGGTRRHRDRLLSRTSP